MIAEEGNKQNMDNLIKLHQKGEKMVCLGKQNNEKFEGEMEKRNLFLSGNKKEDQRGCGVRLYVHQTLSQSDE